MPGPRRPLRKAPAARTVALWRIATETRRYRADDLSGAGAAADPGRWNQPGDALLYTTQTVSLAMLETVAHVNPAGLPLNRFLVRVTLPAAAWQKREILDVSSLSPAWSAVPAGLASAEAGSRWLRAAKSPLLLVPSVIVPEEYCVLLNPAHPALRGMRAAVVRVVDYDLVYRGGRG